MAGWNRLTQELIDNGTYRQAARPRSIPTATARFTRRIQRRWPVRVRPERRTGRRQRDDRQHLRGSATANLALDPATVGTAQLDRDQVLVAPDDTLENTAYTFYFDVIYEMENGIEIKNQLFYDGYENLNENAYGFSQFHDSWVIEDRIVISGNYLNDDAGIVASWQVSPSLRYTEFLHGDDFTNEYFDRRDLTGPSTALDRRLLATRGGEDFDNYDDGDYMNIGLAALVDIEHESGLAGTFAIAGIRSTWTRTRSTVSCSSAMASTSPPTTAAPASPGRQASAGACRSDCVRTSPRRSSRRSSRAGRRDRFRSGNRYRRVRR